MASTEWIEIYSSYDSAALAEEITSLKAALVNQRGISAQGLGGKNYQIDLGLLQQQLAAAIRVQTNRSAGAGSCFNPRHGVADMSNLGGC